MRVMGEGGRRGEGGGGEPVGSDARHHTLWAAAAGLMMFRWRWREGEGSEPVGSQLGTILTTYSSSFVNQ